MLHIVIINSIYAIAICNNFFKTILRDTWTKRSLQKCLLVKIKWVCLNCIYESFCGEYIWKSSYKTHFLQFSCGVISLTVAHNICLQITLITTNTFIIFSTNLQSYLIRVSILHWSLPASIDAVSPSFSIT